MIIRNRLLIALSAFAAVVGGESLAEVAVDSSRPGAEPSLSIMGRTESGGGGDGVEPWPMVRLGIPQEWVLNPSGGENIPADGSPTFAWNAQDQTFEVAWARHDGNDYEIVLSRWDLDHWTAPQLLTSNSVDDYDPQIAFAQDGSARIVFQDDQRVHVLSREPGSVWGEPEPVDLGGLPSIPRAVLDRVAYQRSAAAGATEIVASLDDGVWTPTVLRTTIFEGLDGTEDLDVRIEAAAGRVWIAWEDGPTELGWCELAGGTWSELRFEEISGPEDEEAGRLRIKMEVLR